jgi:hypothetical protein
MMGQPLMHGARDVCAKFYWTTFFANLNCAGTNVGQCDTFPQFIR